jgi:tetratricopeptide (TPR) repeat protein
MFLGIVPVARSANNLATARRSMGGYVTSPISQVPTSKAFQQVIDADPFDPTPCLEYARWLAGLSAVPQVRDEALALALDALALALRRDPHSLKLRRLHMQLLMERADAMKSGELYDEAIAVGRASLELYPQDPEGIIAVAEITLRAGTATGRQDWLRAAIADYDRALALNEQRPDSEELHRLRETDVREALSKISDARRYIEEN